MKPQPQRRSRHRSSSACSLAVVLVVAGCGGQQSDTSAGGSTPSGPATTATASVTSESPSPTSTSITTSAAEPLYLSDLSSLTGAPYNGEADVNGEYFPRSVQVYLNPGPQEVEYDLGRDWQRLQATVGMRDDSASDAQVRIEMFGDNNLLYSHVFGLGQSEPVDVDVSNVLRLRLVATLAEGGSGATAALGDARLVG
jgi:hypothetical protein